MTTSRAGRSPRYPTIPHTLSGYLPLGVRSAKPGLASVAGTGQVEGKPSGGSLSSQRATGVRTKCPSTVTPRSALRGTALCAQGHCALRADAPRYAPWGIAVSALASPHAQVLEHPVPAL